jgi:hypothetical protein
MRRLPGASRPGEPLRLPGRRGDRARRRQRGRGILTADGERDAVREAISEAIQRHIPKGRDALLTGWTLVAEWVDHDGDRWLTREQAASTTQWSARGMHHEALNGDWADPED